VRLVIRCEADDVGVDVAVGVVSHYSIGEEVDEK